MNAEPHAVFKQSALTITAIAGHHRDAPSIIYRIEDAGRSVTFSGDIDAQGVPNLTRIAKKTDLLVFNNVVLDPPDSPRPADRVPCILVAASWSGVRHLRPPTSAFGPSRQESIMTRSLLPFILCTVIAAQAALADDLLPAPPAQLPAQSPPAQSPPAQAPSEQAVAEARAACETDIQKLCTGVKPGGGRILACLKQHKDQVSDGCKQAVVKATKGSN